MLCGDRWASTEHTLLLCPKIRKMWKESCFWLLLKRGRYGGFLEIAAFMEKELEWDEYGVWVIMVWKVWNYVCEITYGEKGVIRQPGEEDSRALWDSYQKARSVVGGEMRLGVRCGERSWARPVEGVLRVDVDALYDDKHKRFGVGVIMRDGSGRICAALSKRTNRKANVMMAEMMAVVEGIMFSLKMGGKVFSIYTDSLLVARLMASEDEVRELLPDDIGDIFIKARESGLEGVHHMYRTANRAAHALAQKWSDFATKMIWIDSYPRWLRDIVTDDLLS